MHTSRAGYVALVGPPNSGKSTLLNVLVGERLAAVTPKAQTTWRSSAGIRTRGQTQMILLDTPGILVPRDLLQRAMLEEVRVAVHEADVTLLVLDGSRPLGEHRTRTVSRVLEEAEAPLLVAVNKSDVADPRTAEALVEWGEEGLGGKAFRVSARRGSGLDLLEAAIESALPASPHLYPADEIAREPVRFFVAELVRETVFEQFSDEIPYSVYCAVEEFREEQEPLYVQVTLYVERTSQKGILVGKGGHAIRGLGAAARRKLEHFLGRAVYLDLWVKTRPNWRRKRKQLLRWGFRAPPAGPPEVHGSHREA